MATQPQYPALASPVQAAPRGRSATGLEPAMAVKAGCTGNMYYP